MASDEEIARTGRTDQWAAGTRDFAQQTARYWQGLRGGGMTRGEATIVTSAYVRAVMEFASQGGKS